MTQIIKSTGEHEIRRNTKDTKTTNDTSRDLAAALPPVIGEGLVIKRAQSISLV
jgi:hypothetical protein